MNRNITIGRKMFIIINVVIISAVTISCIIPIITLFCMSLSSSAAVDIGAVGLWPVDFTTDAYHLIMKNMKFWTSLKVTCERLLLGVPINMLMVILAAYPLSKSVNVFKARKYYIWFFVITMLFGGGLIPTYIVVSKLTLVNTLWALVLPGAVPVFDVILLMNFFRSLPKEIEESALIDGAGQIRIMWSVFIPLSTPALATICLFVLVGHWNSWFDGLIYMNNQSLYPLQTYLQQIVTNTSASFLATGDLQDLISKFKVSDRNLRAAQLFVSMIPVLLVYPWLQKYFTTGIVMGSVKG